MNVLSPIPTNAFETLSMRTLFSIVLAGLLAGLTQATPPDVIVVPPNPAVVWKEVQTLPGKLEQLSSATAGKWLLIDDTGARLIPAADGKSAFFAAEKVGRYRVIVLGPDEPARIVLVVGDSPPEPLPPDPKPQPAPEPKPKPEPIVPVGHRWIVIVEDTAAASAERGKLFADNAIADRLKAQKHNRRIVDKNVVDVTGKPPADLAPYLGRAAKVGKYPHLFIVDDKGKVVFDGDCPTDPAAFLKLLIESGG